MPTEVELVTPERVLYSGEAGFVVLRTDDGEIMFLPEHAPFVAAVDICVVRIDAAGGGEGSVGDGLRAGSGGGGSAGGGSGGSGSGSTRSGSGSGEVRAAVAGGFVHVADNRVTVLAGVAELADEIDVERARRAFEAASAEVAAGGRPGAGRDEDQDRRRTVAPAPPPGAGEAAEPGGEPGHEEIAETPTMRALIHPDEPDVRARRAANRLDAAGEADQSTAAVASGAAPAAEH